MADKIIRKGIAFDPDELKRFDEITRKKGYKKRSQAIRDLVRKEITKEDRNNPESAVVGTLTILYDHHKHDVQHNLTHIQHDHPNLVRSSLHLHVDHDNCLEVLVLQGKYGNVKKLSDAIISCPGISQGELVISKVVI